MIVSRAWLPGVLLTVSLLPGGSLTAQGLTEGQQVVLVTGSTSGLGH